jgi:uncharacterized membrane protein
MSNTITTTTELPSADNRPLLIAASCVAIATLIPVTLYQLDIIPKLPDPPLSIFDSERITKSKTAHPLGIPDGLLGLASFGTTLTLALLAKQNGTAKKLLGVKLGMDASVAAFNAVRQVVSFGKLCSWCTATALSAGVMAYAGRHSISAVASEAKGLTKDLSLGNNS